MGRARLAVTAMVSGWVVDMARTASGLKKNAFQAEFQFHTRAPRVRATCPDLFVDFTPISSPLPPAVTFWTCVSKTSQPPVVSPLSYAAVPRSPLVVALPHEPRNAAAHDPRTTGLACPLTQPLPLLGLAQRPSSRLSRPPPRPLCEHQSSHRRPSSVPPRQIFEHPTTGMSACVSFDARAGAVPRFLAPPAPQETPLPLRPPTGTSTVASTPSFSPSPHRTPHQPRGRTDLPHTPLAPALPPHRCKLRRSLAMHRSPHIARIACLSHV